MKKNKQNFKAAKRLILLGAPSCLGGNVYGCERGPDAIRKILIPLLRYKKLPYRDLGDVHPPITCVITNPRAKCLKEIKQTDNLLLKKIRAARMFDRAAAGKGKENNQGGKNLRHPKVFPVLMGGDHSLNYSFILEARRKIGKIGLVWLDAHADFNTPSITPSGNVHGMVLAGLARKLGESNICIFGVRDMDPLEKIRLAKSKITVITMDEVREMGVEKALKKAIKSVSRGTKGIHLSFDLDLFDPRVAPGTGTPVKDGFNKNDLKHLLRALNVNLNDIADIVSADVMELNPLKDKRGKTARLAAEIIAGLALLSE